MNNLIKIKIPDSTSASPLRFFQNFYSESKMEEAKKIFLSSIPKINDEGYEYPPGCCVTVNEELQTWSVEFDEIESFDEKGWPIFQTIIIEYSFLGELEKLIRNEFFRSWNLFNEKFKLNYNEKRKKDLSRNFIKDCLNILDLLQNIELRGYQKLLERPLRSLIRCVYTNFIEFAPSQKIDDRIGGILLERESSIDLYHARGLKVDLVDEITELKDEFGNSIIKFGGETDKNLMKSFLNKEYHSIKGSSINVIGEVGSVSYFLHQVIQISRIKLKAVQDEKFFKINSTDFISAYVSTEKYRISIRNELTMLQIEGVISRNIF